MSTFAACRRSVPFAFFRSGTSRGLFLCESDVPPKGPDRDALLASLMGSGHPSQLEGFGGGSGPTSKAVIVGTGSDSTVTYSFAQCRVAEAGVDHSHGDCGNMLAAVAPFAIERGLVALPQEPDSTSVTVRIVSLVTNAVYDAEVTLERSGDERCVRYAGDHRVAGVPAAAAPVVLTTRGVAGSQTGRLLPAGSALTKLDLCCSVDAALATPPRIQLSATLIDFARALVILDFEEVARHCGYAPETRLGELSSVYLEGSARLNAVLEAARQEASRVMGMGNCAGKDAPKVALVARPSTEVADAGSMAASASQGKCMRDEGAGKGPEAVRTLMARYWVSPERSEVHPTLAMTAAQAIGAACLIKGSVAHRLTKVADTGSSSDANHHGISILHGRGAFPVSIGTTGAEGDARFPFGEPSTARYVTTVRPIAEGRAFVHS